MSPASNKPYPGTAAGVARAVSRTLRKAGYAMADTRDRYAWTEGLHVHRVGYSSTISVDYHVPSRSGISTEAGARRREKRAEAIAFLNGIGYRFAENGYMECESSGC